ncbi:hypothetical protein [Aquimarina agarivorans]|uniref:hypothetical protein n=1 Tax=Aquimarina agarivorans TaxID=980584 RepID=UPI000248FC50|nr:hypothetical protein [Aquimarina agarivorans]
MIAGETEALLRDEATYDDFLFGLGRKGRRRNNGAITERIANRRRRRSVRKARRIQRRTARRNNPVRAIRRERRRRVITDLGTIYRNAGRATGIGQQIDALTPQLAPEYSGNTDTSPSDYKIAVGAEKQPEKSSGMPKVALAIGGVAVVGLIGVLAMKKRTY